MGVQPDGVRGFKQLPSDDGLRRFCVDTAVSMDPGVLAILQGFRDTRIEGRLNLGALQLPRPREGHVWLVNGQQVTEIAESQ